MALRMLELAYSRVNRETVAGCVGEEDILASWTVEDADGRRCVTHILLDADHVETVMDALQTRLLADEGFRMVLVAVEATLPRPKDPDPADESMPEDETPPPRYGRVSREELLSELEDGMKLNRVFLALAGLSALVAGIGLIGNNVAVVIGAMVIAPLLGPNMGLALATTLGDGKLAAMSLKSNAAGLAVAFGVALGFGGMVHPDPSVPEIASRTTVGYTDVALAIVSGLIGALSFTSGARGTLIGVMVAVAMMPPLVTTGMLLAAGHFHPALGALHLLAVNVIAVNLAAVTTFLLVGIRPWQWWKQKQARRYAIRAIVAWALLLAALGVGVVYAR